MGRLVDSVMAAVGLKPSDRVTISHQPMDPKSIPQAQTERVEKKETDQAADQVVRTEITQTTQSPQPELLSETDTQLQEKLDCMSCRLTGLALGTGTTGFILHSLYTRSHLYKGRMRVFYIGQGLVLATTLTTLGLCRFFEVSIFDPKKRDMSLHDHIKEELTYINFSNKDKDVK